MNQLPLTFCSGSFVANCGQQKSRTEDNFSIACLCESPRAWNVALISFGQGLDFSTSMGKLFYQLSGAFTEFERDWIRERVKAGMRNAKAKGRHIGRPRAVVDAASKGQLLH